MGWIAENPLVAVIVACEVGFWVFLGLGLLFRYALRMPKAGLVFLVGTPVLDVVLLVAAALDLRGGGEAGTAHGIGAVYLGASVVYGHGLIRWADQRVAHRFFGGPPPVKPVKGGAYEWKEWGKGVLMFGIATAVVLFLSYVVATPEQTRTLLEGWLPNFARILGIWFLLGPLWSVFGSRRKHERVP